MWLFRAPMSACVRSTRSTSLEDFGTAVGMFLKIVSATAETPLHSGKRAAGTGGRLWGSATAATLLQGGEDRLDRRVAALGHHEFLHPGVLQSRRNCAVGEMLAQVG